MPSYNVLTGEFVDPVLDSKYFGGKCEYVYNGEWRKFTYESFCESLQYRDDEKNYRKPYNYHTYRFVVWEWKNSVVPALINALIDMFEPLIRLRLRRRARRSTMRMWQACLTQGKTPSLPVGASLSVSITWKWG